MLIPSPLEAKLHYTGLSPDWPVLVARTGATRWEPPTGPEGDQKLKELRTVGNHPIREAWRGDLPHKIIAFLRSTNVKWTSINVLRIGNVEEYFIPLIHIAPVILWIGVTPGSLSASDGVVAAFKCRKILEENGITDVEVEIHESVVTRLLDDDPPTPPGGKKKGGKKKGRKKKL